MKVTMKDVAEEAGVSTATVSHVINGTKKVTEATERRIQKAIDKFNYVPNMVARNLRQQNSKTTALVIPSILDSYVTGHINGVGNRARELGYNLLFINTNEDGDFEKETISMLQSKMIDGIILSPTANDASYLNQYIKEDIPIILMNRYDEKVINAPRVTADDFQAGYKATSHLINHGHKNIGVIYAVPNITPTIHRIDGYYKALAEHQLNFNKSFTELGYATVEGGAKAFKKLIKREKHITAVFILNDLMTIGVLAAAKELNYSIPNDIAIIGFGDFDSASIVHPPVTNVGLSPSIISKTAFDTLIKKMNNIDYNEHIKLPVSLIVRQSCGCN